MTDHDALIRSLADGLLPVRRLWSPWLRALLFVAGCFVIAAAMLLDRGTEALSRKVAEEPAELVAMLAAGLTAALAALAAFQLALPGRSARFILLPIPPMLLWLSANSYECVGLDPVGGPEPQSCFKFIVFLSVPLSVALFLMLRRARPLRPARTAMMAGLAAAAAAAALLQIEHPLGITPMDLAAHVAAVGLVIVINRLVSGPALRRSALLLLLAWPLQVQAQLQPQRPIVLELYTSQGCSSCPPADALLTELARRRADVLPLAFHVDYWNRLGWVDPFSSPDYTLRERLHSAHLGEETIYTPELFVDGARAVIGSDREAVADAIRDARARAVTSATVIASRTPSGELSISVGPGTGIARILVVGFDRSHTTPIGRGENTGRTLQESNIVRSMQTAGEWRGQALTMKQPWPEGERAAILLESTNGQIIGAATTP